MKKFDLLISYIAACITANSQNVGIGISSPEAKLHIRGSANVSQLIIDAGITQSSSNPLIKLRSNDGSDLMWIHSDAESNVFIGTSAGQVNNAAGGGTGNIFIGDLSGQANTIGRSNTGLGFNTLLYNTIGAGNTAIGYGAMYVNTTAGENTAIGCAALFSQTYNPGIDWESYNTAVGFTALYLNNPTSNANGIYNTAIGHSVLYANKTGMNNTGLGSRALRFNTTGTDNTAMGKAALITNTTGKNNTAVGSGSDVSANDLENTTAIGYAAVVNASNKMQLGNTITSTIATSGGYTIASDGRFKENLRNDVKGLEFIMKLQPYTYNFSYTRYDAFIQPEALFTGTNSPGKNDGSLSGQPNATDRSKYKLQLAARDAKRETGFIAQDVEKAVIESGYTAFNGVYAPTNNKDNYSLDYSKLVVPLVKAVQEQEQQIEILKKEIAKLKSMQSDIEKLKAALVNK